MSALLTVLAGTERLSRRDRAALTLALELVRRHGYWDVRSVLYNGADYTRCVSADALDAMPTTGNIRAARARLALLLRLVLRGEAPKLWRVVWDNGRGRTVGRVEERVDSHARALSWQRAYQGWPHRPHEVPRIERIVPLWERAPVARAR